MINISLFSQRDPRWSSKMLGTSKTSTLGGYGCLVTSLAMVCKYYGKDTDPDRLNTALVGVSGFANDSYYIWGSVTKVYGDIKETQNVQTPNLITTAQFASFDAELQANRPIIIEVDFNPNTVSVDPHFVVIVSGSNGNYTIADPWYGDTASLSRYGVAAKTIQRYIFTSGPIPDTTYKGYDLSNADSMKVAVDVLVQLQSGELVRKEDLTNLQKQFDDLKANLDSLTQRIADLEGTDSDLQKQLDSSNAQVQSLTEEKQTLQASIDYYQPYKSRYENALQSTIDKYSAGELLSMGWKKFWEDRKLSIKKQK